MTITPTALRRNLLVLGLSIPLALLGCDPKTNDTGFGGTTGGDVGSPGGDGGAPGGGSGPGATDDTGTGGTGGGPGGGTADSEYGPENTWWHAMASDVPDGLAGSGRSVGDIASNFTLVDQNGDEVELYQFYGQVIVIDAFAEW